MQLLVLFKFSQTGRVNGHGPAVLVVAQLQVVVVVGPPTGVVVVVLVVHEILIRNETSTGAQDVE